jgi:hypothetical protein
LLVGFGGWEPVDKIDELILGWEWGIPCAGAGDWIDISVTDMQNRHTLQIVE